MPGSSTTPGRSELAMVRPKRVAFRARNSVGTRGLAFAAQWLAYALPYRRFAGVLTDANARLGADVDRYSFIGGLAPPTPCRSPGALRVSHAQPRSRVSRSKDVSRGAKKSTGPRTRQRYGAIDDTPSSVQARDGQAQANIASEALADPTDLV
jgi:hypothetical protein